MMSMAGGWFFLATVEGLEIGDHKYWLPGIGSYIHAASTGAHWDWQAIGLGVLAMMLMIVALDQLLWRPVVAWAKKFRVEEGGAQEEIDLLVPRLAAAVAADWFSRRIHQRSVPRAPTDARGEPHGRGRTRCPVDPTQQSTAAVWLSRGLFLVLSVRVDLWRLATGSLVLAFSDARRLVVLLLDSFRTLTRVLIAVAIGTIWTVPAGLAIGLSPRLSRHLQPVVQVLASFPSPLLFPLVILGLQTR